MDQSIDPSIGQQPHYGLAIDTSSAVLTLALGTQEGVYRDGTWHLDRKISAQLHPLLQAFLAPQQWRDLQWIAVLKGPGSFTGTRIGVVTARILAQQLAIPLFGVSNLAVAAWLEATRQEMTETWTIAVSQSGRLGYTYGAVYEVCRLTGTITAVRADQLLAVEDWNQVLVDVPHHASLNLDVMQLSEDSSQESLGRGVLTYGWNYWRQGHRPNWSDTLPYYG